MNDVAYRAGRFEPIGDGRGHAQSSGVANLSRVTDLKTLTKGVTLVRSALVASALLFGATPAVSAVTEFVVPAGPEITLQDGRAIDGHIVGIDQTDIVIQTNEGETESVPRSTVESVTFETVTGRKLAGELIGWTPGIYQITTPEAALKIYSTMPATTVAAGGVATASEARETETPVAVATSETEDAGQGSSQAIAAGTVDETTANGVDSQSSEDVAAVQDAAATPTSDISIQVSVENSKENGPPIAFNISLSKPSESSVVLIYATIDGTAIDGQDYEANRGVVVIKPGEQEARIEASVLDDSEAEEQEHLQLFLTVDPTVAVVENRQIIATIDDDDQG